MIRRTESGVNFKRVHLTKRRESEGYEKKKRSGKKKVDKYSFPHEGRKEVDPNQQFDCQNAEAEVPSVDNPQFLSASIRFSVCLSLGLDLPMKHFWLDRAGPE